MCLAIPGQIVGDRRRVQPLARSVDVAGVRRTVNVGLFDGDEASARATGS